jgi:hypothetical protein
MRMPKKLMSTVACPTQQIVSLLSGHSKGLGFTGAGAIGRRASATMVRSQRAERRRDVAAQYTVQTAAPLSASNVWTNLRRLRCI